MAPRYVWKTVCSDMAREDSQLLMEDMKVFIVVKSQLVPCSEVYDEQMKVVLEKWWREGQLVGFRSYSNNIWMKSEFWRFPHTKSSVTPRTFKDQPDASQQLKARVKDFRQRDFLHDMTPKRNSIEFLLVSPNPDVFRVLARGCHRVYLPELGRSRKVAPVSAQMGSNYARMETEGQPEGGWSIDVTAMSCGYKYHFKFAICIHVLFALQLKHYTGLDVKRTLVNRLVSKKRR
ncbi:hypothetical protein PC121_g19660 [Phytophthora cactorum]|nr:hypothetical protein PC121_g19660 [Phytophthora cactorum]